MKRFVRESEASSSLSISSTANTGASSYQASDSANAITSPSQNWQFPLLTQPLDDVPLTPYPSSLLRDEMYVAYTLKYMFKGPLAMIYSQVLPSNPSGLHPHRQMMNQCLLAMAKVFYALQNHEAEVMQDGIRLYGQGLSTLNEALGKAEGSVTTEMIASVLALAVGEVYTRPLHNSTLSWFAKSCRASCLPVNLRGWFMSWALSVSLPCEGR